MTVFAGSFALVFSMAAAQCAALEIDAEIDRQVDRAIDAGVDALLRAIDGPRGFTPEEKFPSGYAALQVYALVKSDVSYQHPAVQKGLALLESYQFEKVYSVALYLMVYHAMIEQIETDAKLGGPRSPPERARFLDRMSSALSWLLAARLPGKGAWNYEPPGGKDSRLGRFDHSNTQFAVLALGMAAERKLSVPPQVWEEIADHFIEVQEKDGEEVKVRPTFRPPEGPDPPGGARSTPAPAPSGKTVARKSSPLHQGESGAGESGARARGWRYSTLEADAPKFSMSCAGLSSLLMAQRNLPAQGGGRAESLRRALRDGYGWVGRFLTRNVTPFKDVYDVPYDLYSLEKVGDLDGVVAFGDVQWYEEGARLLIRSQLKDGSWGPTEDEAIRRHSTALALLFLDRATDLASRSRPLARITGASGAPPRPAPPGWLYLPSQKAEVPLARLWRLFRYRPSRQVLKMVEEAVKVYDPERIHELVAPLAAAVERSPFPTVKALARKLLVAMAGVDLPDPKRYEEWAERWAEVVRIGKEADKGEEERLRELLRTSEGTPLKGKVVWALQRIGGRAALGDLVDLLESPDAALREAAFGGLTFLSGQSLPFHSKGPDRARAEEVRGWREWLQKEKEKEK
jgi:hypothetical protein